MFQVHQMSRHSVKISTMRFKTQATNTSTTTNYANVAYENLPYNTASMTLTTESNSKRRHCTSKVIPPSAVCMYMNTVCKLHTSCTKIKQ